ncbi:MAG: dipeptidase PepE [Flavobacteriaceae bacterium]|nr:dipeptidase PepE [Bacteroidia bacterium]NNF73588.1 dipeptidase PepE [Flavobacteriaceae bacterium]
MLNAILASTSTVHGSDFLEYLLPELKELFKDKQNILFIPYARPGGISYNEYTNNVKMTLAKINKSVSGIHEFDDPVNAIDQAEGIFVGGGNTFVLTKTLYDFDIVNRLKDVILNGTPYLGTSAGSNIGGQTIGTTNDMPIVYPPSFKALGIVPFNINPHYLDPDPSSTHMGETRETRINEFHEFNDIPVIGLREGSFIRLKGLKATLKGRKRARLFRKGIEPIELEVNTSLV